ncbi:unnamed protein product [Prunus brigantina]
MSFSTSRRQKSVGHTVKNSMATVADQKDATYHHTDRRQPPLPICCSLPTCLLTQTATCFSSRPARL